MVEHKKHRRGAGRGGQVAATPALTPETTPGDGERVAKALARAGVASRREVERLIAAGRVALNGEVMTTPAVKVGPRDILTVDGKPVEAAEATRLFLYHKPAGLVTTHSDPKGRPTVFQALPPGLPRVISVGRLDLGSEGLLLLTNDGGLSRALELPATGLARRYRARARGRIDQARLDTLKDGMVVEGVQYGPIEARLDKVEDRASGANLWITLTLAEGKNREVRRVLEALGLAVNRLIRVAYGPFALAALPRGAVEEVGPRALREQLGHLIAPGHLPKGDRAAWRAPAPPSDSAPEPAPFRGKPPRPNGRAKSRVAPALAPTSGPRRPAPNRKPRPSKPRASKPGGAGRPAG